MNLLAQHLADLNPRPRGPRDPIGDALVSLLMGLFGAGLALLALKWI